MKNKKLTAFACAGVLTVCALTNIASASEFKLLSGPVIDTVEEVKTEESIGGVVDVAQAALPAVVSITNKSVQEMQDIYGMYGFDFGFGFGFPYGNNGDRERTYEYESTSCGSGFIIGQNDEELLICTNYHVIEDATELTVGFVDDEVCEAVLKGGDSNNDLAVVAVKLSDIPDATLDAIKIAQIGNSDDLLIGQQVVAIGNALGYGQSVTTGIVSAMNRTIKLDDYNTALIQTDAAINFGNSGGPLLDMKGHVIGINSAKAASSGVEGMGYAIPITYAQSFIEDLMNRKTRTETVDEENASFVGIVGQDVSEEMASLYGIPQGIYITEVTPGSPADKSGLKKGDIITKFDGSSINSMRDLQNQLLYYAAGEEITITISVANDGEYEEQKVDLTLGAKADFQSDEE